MGVHMSDEEKGDLYLIVSIRSPVFIDDKIREAAKTIARGYQHDVRKDLSL